MDREFIIQPFQFGNIIGNLIKVKRHQYARFRICNHSDGSAGIDNKDSGHGNMLTWGLKIERLVKKLQYFNLNQMLTIDSYFLT